MVRHKPGARGAKGKRSSASKTTAPSKPKTPGKALSDEVRAKVRELRREHPGMGVQAIADELHISIGSVSNILKAARAAAVAKKPRAKATSPAAPELVAPVDVDRETNVERLEELARQLVEDVSTLRDEGALKQAAEVQDRCVRALERLAVLRPPPARDPATDPTNIAARSEVLGRVEALIARAEVGRRALEQIERGLRA